MKNTEIEYKLSGDCDKLFDLLKSGKKVVGFVGVHINGKTSDEYSKVEVFSYNSRYECFDVGGSIFSMDFTKSDIVNFFKGLKIQFFDFN